MRSKLLHNTHRAEVKSFFGSIGLSFFGCLLLPADSTCATSVQGFGIDKSLLLKNEVNGRVS